MDPNEALRRLRKYASDTGGEFGEQFEALDEWLSKGGFLPSGPTGWCPGRVQELNTVEPTSKGPCAATVRINTKTMPCELDAPHPGWAHTNIDSRRTVNWCSDAEAEAVVVE